MVRYGYKTKNLLSHILWFHCYPRINSNLYQKMASQRHSRFAYDYRVSLVIYHSLSLSFLTQILNQLAHLVQRSPS